MVRAFHAALCALPLSLPFLAGGCASSPAGSTGDADLVLRNGKILTLDASCPEARALAVRDGKVLAVGSEDVIAGHIGPSTDVIDLAGGLAIPGFIEGHGHFLGIGDAKVQLDLMQAKTPFPSPEFVESAREIFGIFEQCLALKDKQTIDRQLAIMRQEIQILKVKISIADNRMRSKDLPRSRREHILALADSYKQELASYPEDLLNELE